MAGGIHLKGEEKTTCQNKQDLSEKYNARVNTKTHPREQKETKETKVVYSKDKCLLSAKMPLVLTFARSREYQLTSLRFLRYLLFNFSASVNRYR